MTEKQEHDRCEDGLESAKADLRINLAWAIKHGIISEDVAADLIEDLRAGFAWLGRDGGEES